MIRRVSRWLLCCALLGACRSAEAVHPGCAGAGSADLRVTIEQLYAAFCFDPGAEPDWDTQRRIYLEGAVFVPSLRPDRAPVAEGTELFLAQFRSFVTSEPVAATGLHERILDVRADVFGGVAHAFVLFEGFAPPEGAAQSRGIDSLQFVHDGAAWRLVSFATQYESEGVSLPERL